MTVPMRTPPAGDVMESVIVKGDLAKLTPDERVRYYDQVCRSLGLNPLTQPLEYIVLNGKTKLYASRTCTDQLRKINGVSLEIVSREVTDGVLTFHVRARFPDGRSDEDLGSVSFPDTLKGEVRANAEMKCITKAKRRATLSICGLGWLDETEIEDIPAAAKRPGPPAANVMRDLPPHQAAGDVIEPSRVEAAAHEAAPPPEREHDQDGGAAEADSERLERLDGELAKAAAAGTAVLQACWRVLEPADQAVLKAALDRRHKKAAQGADERGSRN